MVKVDVEPEVEVGNYEGIEVEEKKYSVSKADVDAEIERIRERNSRMITFLLFHQPHCIYHNLLHLKLLTPL